MLAAKKEDVVRERLRHLFYLLKSHGHLVAFARSIEPKRLIDLWKICHLQLSRQEPVTLALS
jgi:hypothetical protein